MAKRLPLTCTCRSTSSNILFRKQHHHSFHVQNRINTRMRVATTMLGSLAWYSPTTTALEIKRNPLPFRFRNSQFYRNNNCNYPNGQVRYLSSSSLDREETNEFATPYHAPVMWKECIQSLLDCQRSKQRQQQEQKSSSTTKRQIRF